jgi:hypothetical protein
MKHVTQMLVALALLPCGVGQVRAGFAASFTKLSGLTGGSPAGTAVYRADLSGSGITNLLSITIQDASFGLGGAAGQFSGFDVDAIKLSNTSVNTAADAGALSGLSVFNFSPAGTLFTPGAQRSPVDSKLFGTDATGTTVDNSVATLAAFDGNSTTAIPGAFGFVSMGDGGRLSFNLTSPAPTSGLFLYIGEVGDNGEVAAGTITVSHAPANAAPEPSSLALLGLGTVSLIGYGWRRQKQAVA